MTADISDGVDIIDVRTRLYHGGVDYLRRRHPHNLVMAGKAEPGDPHVTAFDAYEGYCAAGIFQIAISTILRYLAQEAPEHAQIVARIADEVMESGLDALDDTNDDLPHPVPAADGPTAADIEAALDAKAEDDRIEAERAR